MKLVVSSVALGVLVALALATSPASDAKTAAELTSAGSPEQKGEAIARELDARNAGFKDLGGAVEMSLRDTGGSVATRKFSLKVLERPEGANAGDWSLIVFDAPADVKGTAVLSHAKVEGDDEQWLYLPSAKRTKRVSTSNRTGSFAGSEFSFEDLTASETRKYAWKLAGTEACGADQCFVLEATPKDRGSAYSKRVLRVETNEMKILSTELFDRGGAKIKTLTYDGYKKLSNKFWRAQTWTMKNASSGKSTELRFTSMSLGNGFSSSDFSSGKLEAAR
jgi:outer membrane lipoprotein-sorting protein